METGVSTKKNSLENKCSLKKDSLANKRGVRNFYEKLRLRTRRRDVRRGRGANTKKNVFPFDPLTSLGRRFRFPTIHLHVCVLFCVRRLRFRSTFCVKTQCEKSVVFVERIIESSRKCASKTNFAENFALCDCISRKFNFENSYSILLYTGSQTKVQKFY